MNNNPSNTPRTDAVFQFEGAPLQSSYADFARTLERELNAAQDREEGLRMTIEQFISNLPGGHTVDPQSVADDLRGILSASPSGQRFVRREVLDSLAMLAAMKRATSKMLKDDGWDEVDELTFQEAQAELARTKGEE